MQQELETILRSIDELLDSYEPGVLDPDRMVGDVFAERASQRPTLENAIAIATEALERFPFHPELVRRRAIARTFVVTPDGEYPHLEAAEADFRLLLDLDPNNLVAAKDLLDALFTFSGLEDSEVAEIADTLASKAEGLFLELRALQVKALGYAHQHKQAEELYRAWSGRFPDAEVLQSAIEDARSMNPDSMEDNDE